MLQTGKSENTGKFGLDFLAKASCGLPGLVFINPHMDSQAITGNSRELPNVFTTLLKIRQREGMAKGSLQFIEESSNKKAVYLLTLLPSGNFWLLAMNFGKETLELPVSFPKPVLRMENAEDGVKTTLDAALKKYVINLPGQSARNIIFFRE